MTKLPILLAGLGVLTLAAAPVHAQGKSEEANEQHVPLSQVPKPAVDAAEKALGTKATEAEMVKGKKGEYELSAKDAAGKEQSVHVTAAGKIVKRESKSEAAEGTTEK